MNISKSFAFTCRIAYKRKVQNGNKTFPPYFVKLTTPTSHTSQCRSVCRRVYTVSAPRTPCRTAPRMSANKHTASFTFSNSIFGHVFAYIFHILHNQQTIWIWYLHDWKPDDSVVEGFLQDFHIRSHTQSHKSA